MDQQTPAKDPLEYINCVFYFETSPPRLGNLVRRILSPLQGLPLPKVELLATREDSPGPSEPSSEWPGGKGSIERVSFEAHTLDGLQFLDALPSDTGYISMQAVRRGAERRAIDSVWSAHSFSGAGGGAFTPSFFEPELRRRSDTSVVLSFRSSFLNRLGADRSREVIDSVISAVVSHSDCYYGFVECENGEATSGIALYTPLDIEPYGRHVVLPDAVWWHEDTDRHTHVRGIYWGNVFGPALARRFLSQRDLLSEFAEWTTTNPVGRRVSLNQYGTRFENGSIFLALSPRPLDASEWFRGLMGTPGSTYCRLAAWLHIRCRELGMLA